MSKNNRKKVYTKSRKQDKNGAFGKLMVSIIILGVVVLLFINYALPIIKEQTKKVVADKTVDAVTENIDKIAADNPEIQQVVDKMTEEDKEKVKEIVAEHVDSDTVTEVMEYVNSGDEQGLMEYAVENLSPDEISELMELYNKYTE